MNWRYAQILLILSCIWLYHRQHNVLHQQPAREPTTGYTEQPTPRKLAEPPPLSISHREPSESYQDLLEKDLFCRAARESVTSGAHRREFLRSLGLELDPRYREFTDTNSPLDAPVAGQNYASPLARLTQALRLAGLLVGTQPSETLDLTAAWEILNQLHKEDPSNAAYPLFRLVVEHDMQKAPEDLRITAEELLRATHINSLYTEFGREIFTRMQSNASKFAAGIDFLATLPMPDYQTVRQAVNDLDMDFPGLASSLGQLMIQPGLQAAGNSISWTFNALEYSLGRVLAPEIDAPKIADLDRMKNPKVERWQRLVDIDESTWGECDSEVQERFRSESRDVAPL